MSTMRQTIFNDNKLNVDLGDGIKGIYIHLAGQDNILLENGATTEIGGGRTNKLTTEKLDNPTTKVIDPKRNYEQVGPGEVIEFDEGKTLTVAYQVVIGTQRSEDVIYIEQGNAGEEDYKFARFQAPEVEPDA